MNKRLIISFVCIAVFVLTLVVGAVVFTVNDVKILLQSDKNISFDKAQILETSGIKKGQSVFTIDKEEASAKIEKQFPKLNVINIQRIFPNKVRIDLDTRTGILKMPIENSDKFLILDYRYDKVKNENKIKIIDIVADDSNIYDNSKVVMVSGYKYNCNEDALGDFVKDESNYIKVLKSVLRTLDIYSVVNERLAATFESVNIVDNTIRLQTVLGITLVVWTDTDPSMWEKQIDTIYNKFINMKDEEREQPNYLYMNKNGSIAIGPVLDFDK